MPINEAAGCFVIVGNSVLLAKRAAKCHLTGRSLPFPEYWSILAGAKESGENPIVCAQRELFEETQIKVELHQLEYAYTINNDSVELILYCVVLDDIPDVTINEEHTEYGWFDIDELNSFNEKIDHNIVEIISFYKKNRFKLP